MFTVINFSRHIGNHLQYHERKEQRGVAKLIAAGNFLERPEELTQARIKHRFARLTELRTDIKFKVFLASICFHPDDKRKLPPGTFPEIAREYMERLGFRDQPYLVYEHFDSGHPHLHALTTPIRHDGSRIGSDFFTSLRTEKVRKELESAYGLVRADKTLFLPRQHAEVQTSPPGRLYYGREATRPAMNRVLTHVLTRYRFTTIEAFSAVLSEYNLGLRVAREKTMIADKLKLYYSIIDAQGKGKGIPIHARDLTDKPTHQNLEQKFRQNKILRQQDMARMNNAISLSLARNHYSMDDWIGTMAKEGIALKEINGSFIFIDHQTGSVFEEASLGERQILEMMRNKKEWSHECKKQNRQELTETLEKHHEQFLTR